MTRTLERTLPHEVRWKLKNNMPSNDGCAIFSKVEKSCSILRIFIVLILSFEVLPILQAVKLSGAVKLNKIFIMIDCLQAIKTLRNKAPANYLVALFHDEIRKADLKEVLLLWAPGHSGNFDNKNGERSARRALVAGIPAIWFRWRLVVSSQHQHRNTT